MQGFTIIDAVVIGVILLSAILAYSRGFVREIMAIAGWVIAAIVAFMFAPAAQPLIKEIPVVGPKIGDSCELMIIAGFAGIFAVSLVITAFFTPLLSGMINQSFLGRLDQGLGLVFGAARGILLVAVAFVVYERAATPNSFPIIDQSRSASVFSSLQDNINAQIPSDTPGWIAAKYESLVSSCPAPAGAPIISPN